jgi:hypothetical protein
MFVQKKLIKKLSAVNILALLLVILLPFLFAEKAEATGFTQVVVRLDRLKASTTTSGSVCAKPSTAGVENDVQVVFPTVAGTDFTVNSTASNWVVNSTNLPFGATFWLGMTSGVTTASAVSGKTVTFPSGDLTLGTLYCFNFTGTSTLTTGAAGIDQTGTITTRTSVPATIETSSYALSVVSDDQVVVTATVPSTFTFSLGANTDTFASNLSTTAQLSNGVTATIATNAGSGWVAWVKSANAALNSASTGATIATIGTINDTVDSLTASNYGYLLDVTFTDSGTGTGTVTQGAGYGQEYDGNSNNTGGTLSTTFQPIAASSGTTDGDTVTLKALARVTAVQAAATDYTDTLTVVAAGRF